MGRHFRAVRLRLSLRSAQTLFFAFCAVMGLSLASIFVVFTATSIARIFFIAAAMFGVTSLYGYTTRSDLSRFGSFLFMGLFGVVIAHRLGIPVFIGLTAWNTQTIKEQYAGAADPDIRHKMAVVSALSLYLNLINIFQLLLHFAGQHKG